MFPRLAWAQHLNHQRPDAGGAPPYADPGLTRFAVPRGGTAPVRDPAMLSLLGTPFDPFAYTPDVKRADDGALHPNLPNLAIFLWRLAAYRLPVTVPLAKGVEDLGPPGSSGRARYALRFDLDPLDRPVRLFNTYRRPPLDATEATERLTESDAVPGPIPWARLTSGSEAGNASAYVRVDVFDDSTTPPTGLDLSDAGLQLYLPDAVELDGIEWTFRGDNLCAWEAGLRRPLAAHEIVVDPEIGRLVIGAAVAAERDALVGTGGADPVPLIYAGYTYGAVGPVGAHPVSRGATPTEIAGEAVELRQVNALAGDLLQDALDGLQAATTPVVVEIDDSMVHDLDPTTLVGSVTEGGLTSLLLARSLVIRASGGQRPVVRLTAPLGFRPVDPADPSVQGLTVRLEGIFLTRAAGMAAEAPLIARAAVARLELDGCTLDPGGFAQRDGSLAPRSPALRLETGFGFDDAADRDAFEPTPDVVVQRSVLGSLRLDDAYRLVLEGSIVDRWADAGEPEEGYSLASATDAVGGWAAPLDLRGAHLLGRTRVRGGVGLGRALRAAAGGVERPARLPEVLLLLRRRRPPAAAPRVRLGARREALPRLRPLRRRGLRPARAGHRLPHPEPRPRRRRDGGVRLPSGGATGWTNLGIRLREFMPVGVRPLPIAVT